MISPAYAQTMAAYNTEMNARCYAAAARLTDAQRREHRGAFWESIHGSLNHLLWGDQIWMSRFDNWPKPAVGQKQSGTLIDSFAELTDARVRADAEISAWAKRIDDAWLNGDMVWFSGVMQKEMRQPRGILVTHMFNHQTHHRGQVHCLLSQFGEDTGDTDLPFIITLRAA